MTTLAATGQTTGLDPESDLHGLVAVTISRADLQNMAWAGLITVTGITFPASSNICVIPTLRPRNPLAIAFALCQVADGNEQPSGRGLPAQHPVHTSDSVVPAVQTSLDAPQLGSAPQTAATRVPANLRSRPTVASRLVPARSLDLDVHARRQAQLVQRFDRLGRRLHDVDQALVRVRISNCCRPFLSMCGPDSTV